MFWLYTTSDSIPCWQHTQHYRCHHRVWFILGFYLIMKNNYLCINYCPPTYLHKIWRYLLATFLYTYPLSQVHVLSVLQQLKLHMIKNTGTKSYCTYCSVLKMLNGRTTTYLLFAVNTVSSSLLGWQLKWSGLIIKSLMAAAIGVGGTTEGSRLDGTLAFSKARRYLKYPTNKI